MTARWPRIGLMLAALWLWWPAARGDEPRTIVPAAVEIAPEGIPGALLLCGPGCPAEAALRSLERRSSLGNVVVVSVGSRGLVVDIDRWNTLKANGVRVIHAAHPGDLARLAPGLGDLSGDVLWLHCDEAVAKELATTRALWEGLRRTRERGGTIVASGATAAALLGRSNEPGEPHANGRFELLPGCDLCETFASPVSRSEKPSPPASLPEGAGSQPPGSGEAPSAGGRVGLWMDDRAVLSIRGRRLASLPASAGNVRVTLAASDSRPEREIVLRPGAAQDLTALRRAAAARAGEAWPPALCDAPRVERGTLFIVGGGTLTDELAARFVELAGEADARIVVVPTAAEPDGVEDRREVRQFREAGAGRVELLHARDRNEAASDEFLRSVREATAVWFTGGRQWRLVDRYEGTPFVAACRELLARGGVIGGSSAGATIQGDYLVRGSPLGNEEMMAEGYERGFAFLPGTAIDQHFTQRGRGPDMVALKRTFPQWLGIGIDESTALEVRGDRATVRGSGAAAFYDRAAGNESGASTVVSAGGEYDFARRAAVPAP